MLRSIVLGGFGVGVLVAGLGCGSPPPADMPDAAPAEELDAEEPGPGDPGDGSGQDAVEPPAPRPSRKPSPQPKPTLPPIESPFTQRWTTREKPSFPRALAVAPWGDVVIAGTRQLIYLDESGRVRFDVEPPFVPISGGLSLQSDGSLVVVGRDEVARVTLPDPRWRRLHTPDGRIAEARFVDGRAAFEVERDDAVALVVVDLPGGEVVARVDLGEQRVDAIALSPDGRRLAVSAGGRIRLHDVASAAERLELETRSRVKVLAFGPAGEVLFADSESFEVHRLDLAQRASTGAYRTSPKAIRVLPDGRPLTLDYQGVELWRAPPEPNARDGLRVSKQDELLAVSTDGGVLAICGSFELECHTTAAPRAERPFDVERLAEIVDPDDLPETPEGRALRREARIRELVRDVQPGEPEPFASCVQSFVPADAAPAGDACFVRLTALEIGGEFDTAGDEEVFVRMDVDQTSRVVARETYDLPSDALDRYSDPGGGYWIELPAAAVTIDLSVYDADVTENELITGLAQALTLDPAALPTEPRAEALAMATIRTTEYHLLGPNKEVTITGPSVEVEWVRAPRRDAADPTSRRAVLAALGSLLTAELPADAAASAAAADELLAAARQAAADAGRSTHTHLRAVLTALAAQTHAVGVLAARVGAAAPERLNARIEAVAKHLHTEVESHAALAALRFDAPPSRAELEALLALAVAVEVDGQGRHHVGLGTFPLEDLQEHVALALTGVGPAAYTRLAESWEALHAAVRAAASPGE